MGNKDTPPTAMTGLKNDCALLNNVGASVTEPAATECVKNVCVLLYLDAARLILADSVAARND